MPFRMERNRLGTVFYAGGICWADGRHFCNGTESGAGTGAHLRSGSGNRSEDRRPAAKTVRRLPGRTFFRVSAAISGESGRKRQYGRFRLERNTDAVSRSGSRSRRQRRTASAYDGRRTVRSGRGVGARRSPPRSGRTRVRSQRTRCLPARWKAGGSVRAGRA